MSCSSRSSRTALRTNRGRGASTVVLLCFPSGPGFVREFTLAIGHGAWNLIRNGLLQRPNRIALAQYERRAVQNQDEPRIAELIPIHGHARHCRDPSFISCFSEAHGMPLLG